ncbi:MAG TPA: hypothetical protein VF094_04145 [Gaiellaceae bacterium]
MTLDEDLAAAAGAAASHGDVAGVLAAEPSPGRRLYLVALAGDPGRWLVLDRDGKPLVGRADVLSAASIVALCELAGDVAGGGDLAALRQELARLRVVEEPAGIDAAEGAADDLERVIGRPPRVASPAYLDAVGAATAALERALGDLSSPFAAALSAGSGAVDAFVRDVERGYALPLR